MQKHAPSTGVGRRLLSALAARSAPVPKSDKPRTAPQSAVVKAGTPVLTPAQAVVARAVQREMQQSEGLFAPLFFATRVRDTAVRKAAGITTPDLESVPNRMKAPYEDAAQAARRLNRPESDYEATLRESANRQAALIQSIKDMHAGVQPTPSTGPTAL